MTVGDNLDGRAEERRQSRQADRQTPESRRGCFAPLQDSKQRIVLFISCCGADRVPCYIHSIVELKAKISLCLCCPYEACNRLWTYAGTVSECDGYVLTRARRVWRQRAIMGIMRRMPKLTRRGKRASACKPLTCNPHHLHLGPIVAGALVAPFGPKSKRLRPPSFIDTISYTRLSP